MASTTRHHRGARGCHHAVAVASTCTRAPPWWGEGEGEGLTFGGDGEEVDDGGGDGEEDDNGARGQGEGRRRAAAREEELEELDGGAGEVDGRGGIGQPDGVDFVAAASGDLGKFGEERGGRGRWLCPGEEGGIYTPPPLVPGRGSARD